MSSTNMIQLSNTFEPSSVVFTLAQRSPEVPTNNNDCVEAKTHDGSNRCSPNQESYQQLHSDKDLFDQQWITVMISDGCFT